MAGLRPLIPYRQCLSRITPEVLHFSSYKMLFAWLADMYTPCYFSGDDWFLSPDSVRVPMAFVFAAVFVMRSLLVATGSGDGVDGDRFSFNPLRPRCGWLGAGILAECQVCVHTVVGPVSY